MWQIYLKSLQKKIDFSDETFSDQTHFVTKAYILPPKIGW